MVSHGYGKMVTHHSVILSSSSPIVALHYATPPCRPQYITLTPEYSLICSGEDLNPLGLTAGLLSYIVDTPIQYVIPQRAYCLFTARPLSSHVVYLWYHLCGIWGLYGIAVCVYGWIVRAI